MDRKSVFRKRLDDDIGRFIATAIVPPVDSLGGWMDHARVVCFTPLSLRVGFASILAETQTNELQHNSARATPLSIVGLNYKR